MINYIEKGYWLNETLQASGYHVVRKSDGYHVFGGGGRKDHPDDETAAQAIINAFDPLPFAKKDKIAEVKVEAARRVSSIYPFITEEDEDGQEQATDVQSFYQFAEDIYLSMVSQARGPLQPRLQLFKDIRDEAISVISDINAMTDWQLVMAYDVKNTPDWPSA